MSHYHNPLPMIDVYLYAAGQILSISSTATLTSSSVALEPILPPPPYSALRPIQQIDTTPESYIDSTPIETTSRRVACDPRNLFIKNLDDIVHQPYLEQLFYEYCTI